jgi:hypothetical protein
MVKRKDLTVIAGGGGVGSGPTTKGNYQARALEFIKTRGLGKGFVIRTAYPLGEPSKWPVRDFPMTEAQWNAWMIYLARINFKTHFVRSQGLMTVPAEWPEEFDSDAPLSDRDYRPLPKPSRDYRPEIARMMKELAASIQSTADERRAAANPPRTPEQHEAHLAALRTKYYDKPITEPLHPAMLKRPPEADFPVEGI